MNLAKTGKSLLCSSVFFTGMVVMNPIRSAYNERLSTDPLETDMQRYEAEGKYPEALSIAKVLLQEAEAKQIPETIEYFSKRKEELEKKTLTLGNSRMLFDERNQPRTALVNILTMTGMDTSDLEQNSVAKINDWAQKNFLRSGERWEKQSNTFEQLRDRLKPFLEELQLEDASPPSFDRYDAAIIHGALLSTVRIRIRYLIQQWENGIRFADLYFLTGERILEPVKESSEALTDDNNATLKIVKELAQSKPLPRTESEMIQFIWENSEIPEDFREAVRVHYIRAPAKIDGSGMRIRPDTNDTVNKWLQTSPKPGKYLCVSNAPYGKRQDTVMRTLCPEEYQFETIGPASSGKNSVAILLDELARWIFQVKQLQNKKHLADTKTSDR